MDNEELSPKDREDLDDEFVDLVFQGKEKRPETFQKENPWVLKWKEGNLTFFLAYPYREAVAWRECEHPNNTTGKISMNGCMWHIEKDDPLCKGCKKYNVTKYGLEDPKMIK
jgi:hypothetical protein